MRRGAALRLPLMNTRILLLALLIGLAGTARGQVSGVTAELVLEQDKYLPGEDLQLKVSIANRSGQPRPVHIAFRANSGARV